MGFPERWDSFWDLASPEQGAEALVAEFGQHALDAARDCGLQAHADERLDDYLFWIAAFYKLLDREGPNSV